MYSMERSRWYCNICTYNIYLCNGAQPQVIPVYFSRKGKPEEFAIRIVMGPEEIKGLLVVGFGYVCEKNGLLFFRKQK